MKAKHANDGDAVVEMNWSAQVKVMNVYDTGSGFVVYLVADTGGFAKLHVTAADAPKFVVGETVALRIG